MTIETLIASPSGELVHNDVRLKVNEVIDSVNTKSEVYTIDYYMAGAVPALSVLSANSAFSNASGYDTGSVNTYTLTGINCRAAVSTAAGAGNFSVRVAEEDLTSVTQHVYGSGVGVISTPVITKTEAQGARYNDRGDVYFPEIPLTPDKMIFVDVTEATVSLTDVTITLFVRVDFG